MEWKMTFAFEYSVLFKNVKPTLKALERNIQNQVYLLRALQILASHFTKKQIILNRLTEQRTFHNSILGMRYLEPRSKTDPGLLSLFSSDNKKPMSRAEMGTLEGTVSKRSP